MIIIAIIKTNAIFNSVIFEMTAPYLMKMLGAEGKVHTLAVQYTRIIAAAALLQIFGAGLVPIVRNLNMPIQAMAATISGVCSNFVFNTIFIFVLQMGMRGAALGTVLSQLVTSVIASVSIKKSGALSREDVIYKKDFFRRHSFIWNFTSSYLGTCLDKLSMSFVWWE